METKTFKDVAQYGCFYFPNIDYNEYSDYLYLVYSSLERNSYLDNNIYSELIEIENELLARYGDILLLNYRNYVGMIIAYSRISMVVADIMQREGRVLEITKVLYGCFRGASVENSQITDDLKDKCYLIIAETDIDFRYAMNKSKICLKRKLPERRKVWKINL